jgi:two-component system chemotaxis sensor kinase CheA
MDMSQYYGLFISEAREHAKKIAELAVVLENDPTDRPTIDAIFRSAHSVKGMAASMEFEHITLLAYKMEDLMDRVRHGRSVDTELFDLLLAGADRLSNMITDLEQTGVATTTADDLVDRIKAYTESAESLAEPTAPSRGNIVEPTLSKIEEPLPQTPSDSLYSYQTVRVKTGVLDSFVNTTGELITVKHRLELLADRASDPFFSEAVRDLGRHLRELHDQVMTLRLIPLATIADRFPRMVRDLAKKLGKEISLSMVGVDIELDRSIMELLGDPFAHILRNCVDHGIEPPAERVAAGKPPAGAISISVIRNKDKVEIKIADDGRGMESDSIAALAVARGILTNDDARRLSASEKLMLICQPGFTTVTQVNEVSGRGVGMDVVKSTLHSLGGSLSIDTLPGKGASFQMTLPLTIAIINVLFVSVGGLTAAVPLTSVVKTIEVRRDEIIVHDGQEVVFLEEEPLPIIPLRRFLRMPAETETKERLPLFVAKIKGQNVGLLVDRIIGHREVFVKALGRPLSFLAGINGAIISGDGEIVFVLDVLNLEI